MFAVVSTKDQQVNLSWKELLAKTDQDAVVSVGAAKNRLEEV
ncbi:MAG TPA: hypothetical protein VF450_00185 [Noviherbaspirillum sp.]